MTFRVVYGEDDYYKDDPFSEIEKAIDELFAAFSIKVKHVGGPGTPSYKKYMRSDVWARKRKAFMNFMSGRCLICHAGPPFEVHHWTYERVGMEDPTIDIALLCKDCHKAIHGLQDARKRRRAA